MITSISLTVLLARTGTGKSVLSGTPVTKSAPAKPAK
jgi:hypothetical protein